MTPPVDPLELLRAANPVDEERLPTPARSATAAVLYEKITGTPYATPRAPTRTPRRWRLYVGSLVAVGAIGGGAAWAIAAHQPDKVLTVACYQHADLSAASVVASDGRDPVAVCADAWRDGKVGPVPPTALVACVLTGGTAGVFPADAPTDAVCARLGLSPATPPATTNQGMALAALRSVLANQFRSACVPVDDARDLATRELVDRQLTGWTVTITNPATPERPCASLGIDEPGHRVLLVPVPRP